MRWLIHYPLITARQSVGIWNAKLLQLRILTALFDTLSIVKVAFK